MEQLILDWITLARQAGKRKLIDNNLREEIKNCFKGIKIDSLL